MKGLPHKAVAGMPATARQSNREGKQTMKKKIQALLAVAVVGVLAMGLAGCSSGGNNEGNKGNASGDTANLRFVTGGESGTYYAYGNVLAQYATNGEYGLGVTALSGNGSQANVQALQDDDADVAFCQSDVLAYAYEGTNLFEEDGAYKDFSVVASLYQEQVQIVTCNPDIKSVADLKGKTVSVGAAGSGVYFNAIDVLAAYDMTLEDITPVYQSFGDSADSLKDEKIDAAFIVAGAPTTAITDLSTTKQAYLISLDQAHIQQLIAENNFYSEAVIPAGTYSGQDSDVVTVGVDAVIIVDNAVSEEDVYAITADIFDNAPDLIENHAKYAEISLEKGASVASVPYHPGATKYFAEKNITVPTK